MALAKYYEDLLERRLEVLDGIQFNFSENNSRDDLQLLKEKLSRELEIIRLLIEECLDIVTNPEYSDIVSMDSKIKNLEQENIDLEDKIEKMKSEINDLKKSNELINQGWNIVMLSDEISKKNKEIKELQYHLKVVHKSDKYLNIISFLRKDNMRLKENIKNSQQENKIKKEKLISNNSILNSEKLNLKSDIAFLKNKLSLITEQKKLLDKKLAEKESIIKSLESKIRNSKSSLSSGKVHSALKENYPTPKPMASTTKKTKPVRKNDSKNKVKNVVDNEQSSQKMSSEEQYFAYLAKFRK